MPGRFTPLENGEYYHLFNRGSDKRNVFLKPQDFSRFKQTFYYYQFVGPKPKLSKLSRNDFLSFKGLPENKLVEIICYCLMPNHCHFLVKQLKENGITVFMSQLFNSYTKYFNIKYQRVGALFQGVFKAVRIETDEQLIHVSRYIHLNPIVSQITRNLDSYSWSSLHEYLGESEVCSTKEIQGFFPSKEGYKKFLEDQVDYGLTLERIKHQVIEEL